MNRVQLDGVVRTLEESMHWRSNYSRVEKTLGLVERFFRHGSAWQILRVQGGGKRAFKEIFENFAIFDRVVAPLLSDGGTLVDLCSGSTALLALMTFIWTRATVCAVDREKPSKNIRQYFGRRFIYLQRDIFSENIVEDIRNCDVRHPLVVVGVHCCGRLSFRVVEIGNALEADYIIVVPCCVDRNAAEEVLGKPFGGYADWLDAIKVLAPKKTYDVRVLQIDTMPTNANVVLLFMRNRQQL